MNTQLTPTPEQLRKRRRASLGMTLIEIMVVLAIISLILGGVGVVALKQFQAAQGDDARNDVVQIQQAVEQYMLQKRGKCPKNLQELKASGIASRISKDPWGNDYNILCPGEHSTVDVISPGEDGELGTDDDITNYQDEGEGDIKGGKGDKGDKDKDR
jgi:general secretion pathway protein G